MQLSPTATAVTLSAGETLRLDAEAPGASPTAHLYADSDSAQLILTAITLK